MGDLENVQKKAQEFLISTTEALPDAVKQLERTAAELPSGQDFHFYSNFSKFKKPVENVQSRAVSLLTQISSLKDVRSSMSSWPSDSGEAYDWLVEVQDDLLDRVDSLLDRSTAEDRESQRKLQDTRVAQGFKSPLATTSSPGEVKVAKRNKDRPPVPFHVRNIPRPQDKFDVAVDNSNSPFVHPTRRELLSRNGVTCSSTEPEIRSLIYAAEDHAGSLHPLGLELREMTFMESASEPVNARKPRALESTPFTFVDTLSSLQAVSEKLRRAGEIAVDLEHHHYRSFQGLVCLMQISTRDEDFVIDTLAVRSHVGPCLGDVFSNSNIRKVMHGADRDVIWLQRDFGIYVCNMFDTGQAARVLQLPSFGLAHLLEHICGVTADKRYQLADWRLRPLPTEMMKYAREDTHYLLYVYDVLRQQLFELKNSAEFTGDDPFLQVFLRSRDVCLQLHSKDKFTDSSYLHLNGLYEKQFRPDQLAAVVKLYAWRDQMARKEDESTGFVLPNHLLLQIASEMPDNVRHVLKIAKFSHTYVGRNASTIVSLILQAKENPMLTPLPLLSKPGMKDGPVQEEAVSEEEVAEHMVAVDDIEAPAKLTCEDAVKAEEMKAEASKERAKEADDLTKEGQDRPQRATALAVVSRKVGSMMFDSRRPKTTAASEFLLPPMENTVNVPSRSGAEIRDDSVGALTGPGSSGRGVLATEGQEHGKDREVTSSDILRTAASEDRQLSSGTKSENRTSGLGAALFGGSRKRIKDADDCADTHEQIEARLKAQAIESSIDLPFKTALSFNNGVSSYESKAGQVDVSAVQHALVLKDSSRVDMLVEIENFSEPMPVTEAVGKVEDKQTNRSWWPEISTDDKIVTSRVLVSSTLTEKEEQSTSFPPSLSETHRGHKRRKRNRPVLASGETSTFPGCSMKKKRPKADPSASKKRSDGTVTVEEGSFSYEEARKRLGLENLYLQDVVDEEDQARRGKRKVAKKRNTILTDEDGSDVFRGMPTDHKLEGLPPAPRRQVFTLSGNRSATFRD